MIHSAPASRPVHPLPASDRDFSRLRGQLYAMALEHWPDFLEAAQELERSDVSARIEELWRPIQGILTICQAPTADVEAAAELYKRSAAQTVVELGDWEVALLDELRAKAMSAESDEFELRNTDLLEAVRQRLGSDDGRRANKHWLGTALNSLGLLEDKDRRSEGGTRHRFYQFNRQRVLDQVARYGLLIGGSDEDSGEAARPAQQGAEGPGRPNGPEEQDERRLARVPTEMVHGGRWE